MEKIITYENLRSFAYSNDKLIKGNIRGIVLSFFGLGSTVMHNGDSGAARDYAREGIIYVVPYYNPWSWMNRQAVAYTDEIVDCLLSYYKLDPATVKIVSTGGSMGGLSALVYTRYARITPCACITNCPVCDLPYHFTERPDLPRTLYSAFGEYDCDLESAMQSCSPLHLADEMPNIPYTVFHCTEDNAVNLESHSARFVKAMEKEHNITLHTVPDRGHCDLSPEAALAYYRATLSALD